MSSRRGQSASIVASPVLVGAVTVLIVIVAVFLAYNANNGLPFVPTYDVSAELPGGANLVKTNEVRSGGFRVGIVDKIEPMYDKQLGRSIAKIHLKLDKTIEPLSKDSTVFVRSRSALGLKYVEITPGRSKQTYKAGDTIPLKFARAPVEFDDVFNTFDQKTRDASRTALKGYGDALAGRGPSLNEAIAGLRPFFLHLTPVMHNLSDPSTQLDQFFKQIGRTSAQVAPVAKVQADLFANMATTFAAISHDPRALQATIEKAPPTLDTAIASFRVQRPFLADFADLSHRLRPVAADLPVALPRINTALKAGRPILPKTVGLNRQTKDVFAALNDLVKNPNTLLGLKDLTTTVTVAAPLVEYLAPYQTVCDYGNYFFTALGSHMSEDVRGGTIERVLLREDNRQQPNRLSDSASFRPADVPSNLNSRNTQASGGKGPLESIHGQPYSPAIDAQGNADCQSGQTGYLNRLPSPGSRYPAHAATPDYNNGQPGNTYDNQFSGGSHVVTAPNSPGLFGPTYKGVKNLKDVP